MNIINVHSCHQNTYADGTLKKNSMAKGCKDNKWGKCRGCFPCALYSETCVEVETGHINLKKHEAWINTFTPLLTYLMRCNTDVSSLHSGTEIKAVLIYVSDYITKPALKTHVFFDVIKSVFQRNKDQAQTDKSDTDCARKLITQMVNVLGAKMEIGAPMICLYLLGLPDHYTNQTFTTFYWKSFVSEAKNDWLSETDKPEDVKLQLKKKNDSVIGVSPVEDYIHCATGLEHMCLYEWICRCHRVSNGKPIDELDQLDVYNDTDSVIEHLENEGDDCDASSEPCKSDSSDDKHSINSFIVDDETYDLTLVMSPEFMKDLFLSVESNKV